MKIIAGVDGSERSLAALRFASRLVPADRSEFVMFYAPPAQALRHAGHSLSESVLADAVESLPAELQAHAGTMVSDKRPGVGLLAAAKEVDADLIVVGAHSETRHLPFFTGRVARTVAHGAHVPVLIVRRPHVAEGKALKVLLAHCATPACRKAEEFLSRLTWPIDSSGSVIHVVESVEGERLKELAKTRPGAFEASKVIAEYQQSIAKEKEQTSEELRELLPNLPTLFTSSQPFVEEGHVLEKIVKVVDQHEFNLVAVGARRLGPISRLLGSTTEGLLSHCPCSLLIAHADDKVETS